MWAADNIAPANMLFFSLHYDILSLTSLKITQAFHLILGFVENQTVFWDFKIWNSVRITEDSDNEDLDNQGPTVLVKQSTLNIVLLTKLNVYHFIITLQFTKLNVHQI